MLEDERLISELHQGDKKALRQIYLKYKDNLLTIAASLLHDVGAAEEILHDVFVSFAAGAGNIRPRTPLCGGTPWRNDRGNKAVPHPPADRRNENPRRRDCR